MQGREAPIYYIFNELQCEVKNKSSKECIFNEETTNVSAQEAPRQGKL